MDNKEDRILKQAEEIAKIGASKSQLREIAVDLNKGAPPGEEITEAMIKATEEKMERLAEIKKSPEGKCRVIGVDKFYGKDWIEGEYGSPEEALRIARGKTEEAKSLASDHSVAKVFYAYTSGGDYLGGDTWVGE